MYKFCDVYKCVQVLCLCPNDVMYTSFQGSLTWSCGCVGLLGFGFWKSRTPNQEVCRLVGSSFQEHLWQEGLFHAPPGLFGAVTY